MTSEHASADPPLHTYRLPRTVLPRRYELRLAPDLTAARFDGACVADVDVTEPASEITLNALDLEIDEAWVEVGDRRIEAKAAIDRELERATLALADELPTGPARVHTRFRGTLNDLLRGFYRSVYRDADGAEHVIATTQLESTDARRAFPCWDEPDIKATFAITLVVDDGLTAISNGRELESTPLEGGKRAVRFTETMPMSTYLVAFIVGDLEVTEPASGGAAGVPVRVVTPPGKLGLTGFALEVATFCLGYFEHYYGIPYPGDKVDLIAIPDFAAGAMENLGAITFRETALLLDPATATAADEERIADVVAHELAHMWFGDLVTMKWWNGIWLNEAFATFMELLAVDAFRPEWQRWVTQAVSRDDSMIIDSLASTRPIEFPVRMPHEAEGMFDALTYIKGGSVLRMLEQYLGAERFRDGVRLYLDRHRYGNTETPDLWDALEDASGEPCRRIMDSWIYRGGFPVVRAERGDTSRRLVLSHRQLLLSPDTMPHPDPHVVPVLLRTHFTDGSSSVHRVLLETDQVIIELDRDVAYVVVNADGHGFYRAQYGADLRDALLAALEQLSNVERHALVSDLWAAVLAGTEPASTFLDVAWRFGGEQDPNVWRALGAGLETLAALLAPDARELLAERVRRLVGPRVDEVGWKPAPGEGFMRRRLRGELLLALGTTGDDASIAARAREVVEQFADDPTAVDGDVAASCIAVAARHGGDAEYDRYVDLFKTAPTPQLAVRLLQALGRFRSEALALRTLEFSLSPDVRTQDAPFLLRVLLTNDDVADVAWAFIRDRWDTVSTRFPRNTVTLMLQGLRFINRGELAADVQAFFADHPLPHTGKVLDQSLERMRANVALRDREAAQLARSLREPET